MATGIKRKLDIARKNVTEQIRRDAGYDDDISNRSSFFARGLAGEGFNGGYRAALEDVMLALNGVTPNRNGWWEKST